MALRKLPITILILRETKIGNTVYETKKQYPASNKCHNESKNIIALWKKSCDIQASSTKPISEKSEVKLIAEIVASENSVAGSEKDSKNDSGKSAHIDEDVDGKMIVKQDSVEDDLQDVEKNYDALSQTRRKVRIVRMYTHVIMLFVICYWPTYYNYLLTYQSCTRTSS